MRSDMTYARGPVCRTLPATKRSPSASRMKRSARRRLPSAAVALISIRQNACADLCEHVYLRRSSFSRK